MAQRTGAHYADEGRVQEMMHSFNTRFRYDGVYSGYGYDPEEPLWRVILRVKRTVLPRLVCNLNLWWVLLVYGSTLYCRDIFGKEYLPALNIHNVSIPMTLLSFLVAFHAQTAWGIYHTNYIAVHTIGQLVNDIAIHASSILSEECSHGAWEIVRLSNLMSYCFFSYVADEDHDQNDFELEAAQDIELPFRPPRGGFTHLAKPSEIERLGRVSRVARHMLVKKWAMTAAKRGMATVPAYTNQALHLDKIESGLQLLKAAMAKIISELSKPFPLHYFHLVVFIVFCTTTMYAYASASLEGSLSWIPLVFYTAGTSGILEVCRCLSLPFGDDDGLDLPAVYHFETSMKHCFEVLVEESSDEPQEDFRGSVGFATPTLTEVTERRASATEKTALLGHPADDETTKGPRYCGGGCAG